MHRFRIKRLYTFMLQSFLPLFMMTFFICLFIVLMQFLWRYIDDLVGKGLGVSVLAELFFYAALTMVPMALPLAILLASLMTFGNLGEHFELTALKASGISLLKTMRPLVVTMVLIAIGAFFFQNDVLPIAQTKMWTLLWSMRQKSPELDIPEGAFYDQIPGYNIFVEKKNPDTGILYSMMIYDVSKGFDNARIILADSGRLSVTEDKTHLFLRLWQGEQFENLREQSAGGRSPNVPYRRETFDLKEILVPFDANFNRMDESNMRNQYVGKNMAELRATIDSVSARVDSVGDLYAAQIKEYPYLGIPYYRFASAAPAPYGAKSTSTRTPSPTDAPRERTRPVTLVAPVDVDSVFAADSPSAARSILTQAINKARRNYQDYEYKSYTMEDDQKTIRRHEIELMKKFTLSFACIIFFFIGAPLGAIIRKGGLGTPLVISVLLFIFYYIIDNTGYKLARDGKWAVWQGMWLSSAVLLPLGIFFTYKAVNDSAVFNADAYKIFFRRLFNTQHRELQLKEFPMSEVDPPVAIAMIADFNSSVAALSARFSAAGFIPRLIMRIRGIRGDARLEQQLSQIIDYLSNTRSQRIIREINRYPFVISPNHDLPAVIDVNNRLTRLLEKEEAGALASSPSTER
ncbi:MAG: LptF/LptG family permease [Muribaculaceae bacterium]|nr:LptF/LptG family permease [Muribaculaceae bacterium]